MTMLGRKTVIVASSIVVLLAACIVIWHAPIKRELFMSGIVDRVQFSYLALRQGPSLDQLIALMDLPKNASFDDKVDRVREFIFTHSGDGADKDIYGPNGGPMLMIKKMIAHATGKLSKPPALECSWRSGLMSSVLERLGYETRVVNVFTTHGLTRERPQNSHTFLDVKDPKTRKWHTQDPLFDLYWKSKTTGKRAALINYGEDINAILPCGSNSCGWDIRGYDELKKTIVPLLDIFTFFNATTNRRYSVYTSRADLNAVHGNTGRWGKFCDVYFYSCRSGFFSEQDLISKAHDM